MSGRRAAKWKDLDLGVPGVRISRVEGGKRWVKIIVDNEGRIIAKMDDNLYCDGHCVHFGKDARGDNASHRLGCIYSSLGLVKELQFHRTNGIRFRLRINGEDPRIHETIKTLATYVARRSQVFASLQSPPP